MRIQQSMGECFLLTCFAESHLLIDVTFSTPTPGFVNYPDSSPNLAFSLWITSGLPVIWEQSPRPTDSHILGF